LTRIYLDHNATTPVRPEVVQAMLPFLTGGFGNPSSPHAEGRVARRAVEEAREQVALLLEAEPRDLVFTSGATEANAQAILGRMGEGRILLSAVEHPSVLDAAAALGPEGGSWRRIPVDGHGRIRMDLLEEALGEGAALVAVMAANNEVGTLQPLGEVLRLAQERRVPVHVDAVQMPGKHTFSVAGIPSGSASLSGHKFGGPKGVGVLWVHPEHRLRPWLRGGGQERGRRAGTENVAGIVGMGEAARLCRLEAKQRQAALARAELRFLEALRRRGVGVQRHGDPDPAGRLPGTLSLRFPGHRGQDLLIALDLAGVAISLGSACSSGAAEPSRVLAAMGLPTTENLESVRISLGGGETVDELEEAAARISRCLVVKRSSDKDLGAPS
jgi:cysteine desulfurase